MFSIKSNRILSYILFIKSRDFVAKQKYIFLFVIIATKSAFWNATEFATNAASVIQERITTSVVVFSIAFCTSFLGRYGSSWWSLSYCRHWLQINCCCCFWCFRRCLHCCCCGWGSSFRCFWHWSGGFFTIDCWSFCKKGRSAKHCTKWSYKKYKHEK